MIDCEKMQDYICDCDYVVECDITAGVITASTETSCKGFCRIKLVYENTAFEKHECESIVYDWCIETAVATCLNDISFKVANLTIDLYIRGIAAGISCSKGE